MTKAKVIQFRRGRHTVKEKHFLIEIDGVKNREDGPEFDVAVIEEALTSSFVFGNQNKTLIYHSLLSLGLTKRKILESNGLWIYAEKIPKLEQTRGNFNKEINHCIMQEKISDRARYECFQLNKPCPNYILD